MLAIFCWWFQVFGFSLLFYILIACGREPTDKFEGEIGAELAFQSQLARVVARCVGV